MANQIEIKGRKVVGYVRVSTDDQAEYGVSLRAQPERIRAYCEAQGLDLVEIIEDPGQSAKSLDRPGLHTVRYRLHQGMAEGVVVSKLDRLTRHVGDWNRLLEDHFEGPIGSRSGSILFSASETVDTRSPHGRMILNMVFSVDQYVRENIAETTSKVMFSKRANGERTGQLAYGCEVDGSDPRRSRKTGSPIAVVVSHEEQEAIGIMRSLRAAGLSYQAIADELQDRGIATKRGITKRSTGKWSKSTVCDLLNRSSQVGD